MGYWTYVQVWQYLCRVEGAVGLGCIINLDYVYYWGALSKTEGAFFLVKIPKIPSQVIIKILLIIILLFEQ